MVPCCDGGEHSIIIRVLPKWGLYYAYFIFLEAVSNTALIIIIIIIFISIIKTIEPMFSFFFASCFNRSVFKRKNLYALLTSLKYSSAWFGGMPVESGRCLSRWYIHAIFDN